MTDQDLAKLLLPAALILPPLVGLAFGARYRSWIAAFLVAWGVAILAGAVIGALSVAAIEWRAATMPQFSPVFGRSPSPTWTTCAIGGGLCAAAAAATGFLAGGCVGTYRYATRK